MHSAVVRRPQKVGHRHLQLVHASPASRNLLLPGTAGAGARMPRRFRLYTVELRKCLIGVWSGRGVVFYLFSFKSDGKFCFPCCILDCRFLTRKREALSLLKILQW
ncbi:hypothetical protein TRIUR3_23035 [Triticum urartu]|uniref:Uncharacterized protein n=1 Tax=Triticum urartu TaxID=4572 RepID=M7YZB2_TRIUA|nr:hypothetical protein TRIUR3_23035 [Triticum urartu]